MCPHHARRLLGVEVRPSLSVKGSYGLFAVAAFRKGDAVVPYTGRRWLQSEKDNPRPYTHSPYAVRILAGRRTGVVDAACRRGLGAFVNAPTRGSTVANLRLRQLTLHPRDRCIFEANESVDDDVTHERRWYTVRPLRYRGARKHPVQTKGFRRFPRALIEPFLNGEPNVWMQAVRDIAPEEELLVYYGVAQSSIINQPHRTGPK